jgi:hypothetical protein
MTKQKVASDKPRIQSNSGKLTGWLTTGSREQPVDLANGQAETTILREEDEEQTISLHDIPEASKEASSNKRSRTAITENVTSSGSDTDDSLENEQAPSRKRPRRAERDESDVSAEEDVFEAQDDKKRLGLKTSYDGFSIYGRILCLIVKRKGSRTAAGGSGVPASSQQMLENWVSTQAAAEQAGDDDDDND